MALDMETLERAFGLIEEIASDEETFYVGNIPITVRPMSDAEETDVMKFAYLVVTDNANRGVDHDFMHRMKIGTLSHAIVQIGDHDLREKYVETDQKTKGGRPVRREKAEFVRNLLGKWPGIYLSRVFGKYGEVMQKKALQAEDDIAFDPVDYDSEIERLRSRIADLEKEKEKENELKTDQKSKELKRALEHNARMLERQQAEAEAAPRDDRQPTPPPAPQYTQQIPEEDVVPGYHQPQTAEHDLGAEEEYSDEDEAVIERARQIQERRQQRLAEAEKNFQVDQAYRQKRQQILNERQQDFYPEEYKNRGRIPHKGAQQAARYQDEPTTLTDRQGGQPEAKPGVVNPDAAKSSRNPRFRPPQ